MEDLKSIMAEHERLGKRIEELRLAQEKNNNTSGYKVGQWYKHKTRNKVMARFMEQADCSGYGISGSGLWYDKYYFGKQSNNDYIEALPEEISEALAFEAKIRGIVPGVQLNRSWMRPYEATFKASDSNGSNYEYAYNCLYLNGMIILSDKGVWATIVKEEPEKITIGGYEVKFVGKAYDYQRPFTMISENIFYSEFWEAALMICKHDKATVKIGCSMQFELNVKLIQKIIERLASMQPTQGKLVPAG